MEPRWIWINFIILAFAGVLLRYMHCFPTTFNYQFLLHAHSHFAFAGWMFLALAFLLMQRFFENAFKAAFRKLFILTMLCAYAMLLSFFLSGYKALSIVFSTLFIFITYWFAILVYRQFKRSEFQRSAAAYFLKGSVFYLVISSGGPFLLGYLQASGADHAFIYQNSIYAYLHYQMNGWMQLAALALIFSFYIKTDKKVENNISIWIRVFVWSILPLFFIFVLWTQPPVWAYLLAFIFAALHLISWFKIMCGYKKQIVSSGILVKAAFLAISLKVIFQVLICFPQIGDWAFNNRNLIIAYLHLLSLACVNPILIDSFERLGYFNSGRALQRTHLSYLVFVIAYLSLLFADALMQLFMWKIPGFSMLLLAVSVLLMLSGGLYFLRTIAFRKSL